MQAGFGVSLAILAGGCSSRMGHDKADLLWNGRTFLEWQIEKGRELGLDDILVAGYHGSRCPVPVVPDRFPGGGPLAGIEACIRQAKNPACLILSVDTPRVPVLELRRLLETHAQGAAPITLLRHRGKDQPLMAVYDCSLAEAMELELREGSGSPFHIINDAGYAVCDTISGDDCFVNINREEDYKRLCQVEIV